MDPCGKYEFILPTLYSSLLPLGKSNNIILETPLCKSVTLGLLATWKLNKICFSLCCNICISGCRFPLADWAPSLCIINSLAWQAKARRLRDQPAFNLNVVTVDIQLEVAGLDSWACLYVSLCHLIYLAWQEALDVSRETKIIHVVLDGFIDYSTISVSWWLYQNVLASILISILYNASC